MATRTTGSQARARSGIGPVVADPATLPFRNLRPGLRLRPGANATTG